MNSEVFNIVVIDDSRSVLMLLSRLVVTVDGCEPIPFTQPKQALEWCTSNEPDLVIVDYIMPEMNGLGFIQAFRQLPDRSDVPVVMVTGSDTQTVRYMALQEGATDFVNKPIDHVEFVTRLRNLLVMRQHFKETRERAEILRKAKEEVDQAFEQLRITHSELEATKDHLAEAFSVIEGSIEYASRIQRAILPNPEFVNALFADHFILWEPRDVVGGDIYWCCSWGEGVLFALGDCTGHGVPGAFMTLIATGAFERAQSEVTPGHPGELLARMHQLIQLTLKQDSRGGESDDGMELGLCYYIPGGEQLVYAGARFSLFTLSDDGVAGEVKGDKRGIGYRKVPFTQRYEETMVPLQPGLRFYMTSDGLIDQVGSSIRRGMGKVGFVKLIEGSSTSSMLEQKALLWQAFLEHQQEESRRDDVSVVGFRFHAKVG